MLASDGRLEELGLTESRPWPLSSTSFFSGVLLAAQIIPSNLTTLDFLSEFGPLIDKLIRRLLTQ